MKITLTITTPHNLAQHEQRTGATTAKQVVTGIIANALDEFTRNNELPLVSGNPSRANFETVYGEHVTVKVAHR